MSGQDLYAELMGCLRRGEQLVKEQRTDGIALADAELAYRQAAARVTFALREKGTPVSIIDTLTKGDRTVSTLRKQRDIAEAVYKAGMSAQFLNQTKMRILEAQIAREYR